MRVYKIGNSPNYNFISTGKPILGQHFVFEVIKLISLKIKEDVIYEIHSFTLSCCISRYFHSD